MINSIACWRNCCLVWTVILHSLYFLGQGFPEGIVQYEGQIGGYAIAAILEQDGDSIHGVYVYQSKNIPIALHGVRSGNGQWLLEEFSGDWTINRSEAGWSGSWRKKDGQQLSLELCAVGLAFSGEDGLPQWDWFGHGYQEWNDGQDWGRTFKGYEVLGDWVYVYGFIEYCHGFDGKYGCVSNDFYKWDHGFDGAYSLAGVLKESKLTWWKQYLSQSREVGYWEAMETHAECGNEYSWNMVQNEEVNLNLLDLYIGDNTVRFSGILGFDSWCTSGDYWSVEVPRKMFVSALIAGE